jgi:AraC-like DNA-binding protein
MAKTLLVVGTWTDHGKLIGFAIENEWRVLHTLLFEDITTAFERITVDLVWILGRSPHPGWEQALGRIRGANNDVVVLLSSDCSQDWLVRALMWGSSGAGSCGSYDASADEREEIRLPDTLTRLVTSSVTPTLTLFERVPSSVATGTLRALDFIDAHYDEPITLADAASAACYSRCHFCKIFKQQVGLSFISYLSHVRIRHAKELLIRSDKSITAIAYDVGFNDLSHFERVFRAAQNQSPSQFRQTAKHSSPDSQYPPSLVRHAVA